MSRTVLGLVLLLTLAALPASGFAGPAAPSCEYVSNGFCGELHIRDGAGLSYCAFDGAGECVCVGRVAGAYCVVAVTTGNPGMLMVRVGAEEFLVSQPDRTADWQ